MTASIVRLRTKADKLRSDAAVELRQLVLAYPDLPERARGEIVAAIDRQTASVSGWTFVMISPEQNAHVMRWLSQNVRRPALALTLWGELFTALRHDTGEITLSRGELAERIGADDGYVSRTMKELERFGAVIVRRERVAGMPGPGRAVYFMNPRVGTHLAGGARDRAQAVAPALTAIEGGKA